MDRKMIGKGVPSGHGGVIATKDNKVRRNVRPIPDSLLLVFGQHFMHNLLQPRW